MDASRNLELVSTYSVGFDHVDLDVAEQRDIDIGHTPGVLTETAADYAWSLLMTAARRTTDMSKKTTGRPGNPVYSLDKTCTGRR